MEVFAAQFAHKIYLPWKPIKIIGIGDIHHTFNGGASHTELLKRYIKWGVANDCWFIGTGDYCDFASPSNRQRLMSAALYDTALGEIDAAAEQTERQLAAILAPTKGRWLVMLEGHHYFPHLDGTTTGQRLAKKLEAWINP